MLTHDQILTEDEFHEGPCSKVMGPRNGVKIQVKRWRRSGKTKTWKTRPKEFRIPIKHGLYNNWEITHLNAKEFHAARSCPVTR